MGSTLTAASPAEIAADLDTPVSAYLKLADLKPVFLLESVEGGEIVGRYSFIGFDPEKKIEARGKRLSVDGQTREVGDLLEALREQLGPPPAEPSPLHHRLSDGLVGFLGYDTVKQWSKVSDSGVSASPLPDAAFVAPRWVLVFDHLRHRIQVVDRRGPEAAADRLASVRERLLAGGPVSTPARGQAEPPKPARSKEQFCRMVEQGKEYIRAGDIYQVVLSSRFEGASTVDPFRVYRALRLLNPSPYLYFFDFGSFQIAGSSPEALIRLESGKATLRPIAGTRRRGADPAEDKRLEEELIAHPKERAEHEMLVDLGRNDLGRVCTPGSVHVTEHMTVERYSHVMHLVSNVEGTLAPNHDQFDLFRASFPAGTLSGAPKLRAMQVIEELEGERRGTYGGSFGYFGRSGSMDHAIMIRTLAFWDGRYSYQAGAGIVADSVPEAEYQEVMDKSAALREALELASDRSKTLRL